MPAVTPADVHTLPSRTKIGSDSTVTCGCTVGEVLARRSSASSARLPSSRPAAASTNAPVHTDATRRLRRASRATAPHELVVLRRVERTLAADDDERVDRAAQRRRSRAAAIISGPRVVAHRARGHARHDQLVLLGRAEHLVRTDQVERGDPG